MDGTIGACEAKTRLSALLDRVEKGGSLTITRNGKPVARLVPAGRPPEDARALPEAKASEIVEGFRRLRAQGVKPFTPEEIVDLVRAGRTY